MKPPATKGSKLSRDSASSQEIKGRTVDIVFISKTGERAMSTVAPVLNGFGVTGAHRIVANLVLSPAAGKSTVAAKFRKAAASGVNAMTASLTRDLSDGSQQFTSLAISAPTMANLDVALGVFSGRKVSWNVKDGPVWRTLNFWVNTLDTLGTDEVWHLELCVCVPADGVTDFDVRAMSAPAAVTSVDVTPGP